VQVNENRALAIETDWCTRYPSSRPREFSIGTEIAGTIYRENLSEPASCAVNPALDGADGASANLSGLLVGESGCADQNQRLALFRGQQFECVTKLGDLKSAVLLRERRERLRIGAVDVLNLAPTLAIFGAE
jgi:hypothetical protein